MFLFGFLVDECLDYLSFTQTNDNVSGSKQLLQRTDERASQAGLLVHHNHNRGADH